MKLCQFVNKGCTNKYCCFSHNEKRCRLITVKYTFHKTDTYMIASEGYDQYFIPWFVLTNYLKESKTNLDRFVLEDSFLKCIYDIESKDSNHGNRFNIIQINEIFIENQFDNSVSTNVNATAIQSEYISIDTYSELDLKVSNLQVFLKNTRCEQSNYQEHQLRESDKLKILIDDKYKHQQNKMDELQLKMNDQQKKMDGQQKRMDGQQKRMDSQQKRMDSQQFDIVELKETIHPPPITLLRRSKRQRK